jgi:hypothetical protein
MIIYSNEFNKLTLEVKKNWTLINGSDGDIVGSLARRPSAASRTDVLMSPTVVDDPSRTPAELLSGAGAA